MNEPVANNKALAASRHAKTEINWLMVILIAAIILSAFFVVYVKDSYRLIYIQYSGLQHQYNDLINEQNKDLLQETTWSAQSRIQKIATDKLDMHFMTPKNIIMVRMPS